MLEAEANLIYLNKLAIAISASALPCHIDNNTSATPTLPDNFPQTLELSTTLLVLSLSNEAWTHQS